MGELGCIVVVALAASGCSDRSVATTYLGSDSDRVFDTYVSAIANAQLVSTAGLTRLGTTWDAELARTKQRFATASSATDVYYALVSLKNSFHDAHATLFPDAGWNLSSPPTAIVPDNTVVELPAYVRVEYDTDAPAYRVWGTDDASTIVAGSTLVSVDGVDLPDVEVATREWSSNSSPEALREFVADTLTSQLAYQMPAAHPGQVTHWDLTAPTGANYAVDLTWASVGSATMTPPTGCAAFRLREVASDYASRAVVMAGQNYCIYAGTTPAMRIVRYYSFDYSNAMETGADEAALLAYLQSNNVTQVVFDVRENGGGSFEFLPTFFGSFSSSPYSIFTTELYFAPILEATPDDIAQVLFVSAVNVSMLEQSAADNQGAMFSGPMLGLTDVGATQTQYAPASGSPIQAVVLSGPWCASSCTQFVSIMRDNAIAKVAGMPDQASDSPFRYWAPLALANGAVTDLVLTVGASQRPDQSGLVLEGFPPPVDYPVVPTSANRGGYLDAVLASVSWQPDP